MSDHTNIERISLVDGINDLDGYEELAIEKKFGAGIGELLDKQIARASRAVYFIQRKRAGDNDGQAFDAAMKLKLSEINDIFMSADEDDDDPIPDEPDTEQGKDDSPSD